MRSRRVWWMVVCWVHQDSCDGKHWSFSGELAMGDDINQTYAAEKNNSCLHVEKENAKHEVHNFAISPLKKKTIKDRQTSHHPQRSSIKRANRASKIHCNRCNESAFNRRVCWGSEARPPWWHWDFGLLGQRLVNLQGTSIQLLQKSSKKQNIILKSWLVCFTRKDFCLGGYGPFGAFGGDSEVMTPSCSWVLPMKSSSRKARIGQLCGEVCIGRFLMYIYLVHPKPKNCYSISGFVQIWGAPHEFLQRTRNSHSKA